MMNLSTAYLFNDQNGRITYKPNDVFEEFAKDDKPDYVRFTR